MEKRQQHAAVRFGDNLPKDVVIDVHTEGLRLVVTVSGDLDIHTAPQLRRELQAQARRGYDRIVVDLDGVTFIDSVALGVLVGARNQLAGHSGSLDVVCGNERVLRLFALTGLDRVLTIHAGVAALD